MGIELEIKSVVSAQQAYEIAQEFVANYLTDLMSVGVPWRMRSPLGSVWVAPIWISYPGFAQRATVGSLAVDEMSGQVVSWTPVEEILANARQFHAEHEETIAAGFREMQATFSSNS